MRDNLLTEISRINEIMGSQILSEVGGAGVERAIFGAIKSDLQQATKQAIERILKQDVRALINKGVTSLDNETLRAFINGSDSKLISGIERNIGRSLDAAEANQVKIAALQDLRKVHAEEAAKLAKDASRQTSRKTAEKAGTETATQGININITNKNVNKIGGEVRSLKGKGTKTKTKPKTTGGEKKLTAPEPTPQEAAVITKEVESKTGKELVEEIATNNVKRDWKWWVRRAAIAGVSAYVLWWMFFSDDDAEVPDDIPVIPPPLEDGGGGGGSSTSSYRDCEEEELQTYGCNSSLIKKVQECLGVVVDGKWGPETNTALTANAARFTAGFTEEDIDEICESVTSNNSNNNQPIEYDVEFTNLTPVDMGSGNSSSNATDFGTLNMD